MAKGKPLGPRVTVAVGKDDKGKATHSFMLKSVADYFGFQVVKQTYRKGKNNRVVSFRGTVGSGSIKVPTGKTKTTTYNGQQIKIKLYKQIPVPGRMTIPQIQSFLKKATKNKPDHFVTTDGRTHAVQ